MGLRWHTARARSGLDLWRPKRRLEKALTQAPTTPTLGHLYSWNSISRYQRLGANSRNFKSDTCNTTVTLAEHECIRTHAWLKITTNCPNGIKSLFLIFVSLFLLQLYCPSQCPEAMYISSWNTAREFWYWKFIRTFQETKNAYFLQLIFEKSPEAICHKLLYTVGVFSLHILEGPAKDHTLTEQKHISFPI